MPVARLRDDPRFRRYWAASAVSALGTQVTILALPLTALRAGASPAQVALLSTAGTAPNALGAVLGVHVGRLPRRLALLVADLGRAAVLAALAGVYAAGRLDVAELFAAALTLGTLSVVFELGSQAYLPSLAGRDRLVDANAALAATGSAAAAGGPAVAGALLSAVAAPFALLADAASFLASAAFLVGIRLPGLVEERRPRASLDALRTVWTHPLLRALTLAHALANLGIGLVWSVVVVFAARALGLHAAAIGAALACGQVGALAGSLGGPRLGRRLGLGPALALAFALFGPAALLLAVAPRREGVAFLATGWIVENLARGLYAVFAATVRQTLVPPAEQARVAGVTMSVAMASFPLGTALGGLLAVQAGLRGALAAGASAGFASALPVVLSPLGRLRGLDELAGAAPA
jgi:MFS family permease